MDSDAGPSTAPSGGCAVSAMFMLVAVVALVYASLAADQDHRAGRSPDFSLPVIAALAYVLIGVTIAACCRGLLS